MVTEASPHALEQDLARDHVEALRTLQRLRSLLFFLLILALLMPFVVYALVRMGMVDPTAADNDGGTWYRFSTVSMTLGSFWSLFAAVLLIVTYYLSIIVCLVGRLGSAGQPIIGLLWMVVLLLLLLNWPGRGHVQLPGVFYDLGHLLSSPANSEGGWSSSLFHGLRFLILPLVSVIAAVAADMRYGRGYQQAMRRVKQKLGVTVHS